MCVVYLNSILKLYSLFSRKLYGVVILLYLNTQIIFYRKYIPLLLISRCMQSAPKLLRTSALFVVLPIIAPPLLYLLSINHYYLLCQNINPMMHQKDHHHLPLHFALIDCYYLELAYCTLFCP